MVCVRPGVLLVRARLRRPAMALIALDLPTFERPANAISTGPGGGKSAARAAARINAAWAKTVMEAGNSNKIAPFVSGDGSGDRKRSGSGAGGGDRIGSRLLGERAGQGPVDCQPGLRRVPWRGRQQHGARQSQ